MVRRESVILGRDTLVLRDLLAAHATPSSRILDATANKRRMWKGVEHQGEMVFMDIEPAMSPTVVGDFTAMPFADNTFNVIVFDPPHLPAAAASPASLPQMGSNYGLSHGGSASNISAYFVPFLMEAVRVLLPEGVIFAKLKDYVHNHTYQWSTVDFVSSVRAVPGLTACEHIIKRDPCGGNLKSSRWQNNHHARVVHCSWIVVRKGRCESRCIRNESSDNLLGGPQ